MKIAFTGHRPDKIGNDYAGTSPWSENIYDALAEVADRNKKKWGDDLMYYIGMAQGGDTLQAWVCIDLKIRFTACIPCAGQEKIWPAIAQKVYHDILANPLCTVFNVDFGPYSHDKMNNRNKYMVNQLENPEDGLLALFNGSPGGTKNCIDYARSKQKKVLIINPNDLR